MRRTEKDKRMKRIEAESTATRMNAIAGQSASVVRILPAHVDPIQPNDNGWDVEILVTADDKSRCYSLERNS